MSKKGLSVVISIAISCWMTALFVKCDNGNGPTPPAKTIEVLAPKGGESFKVDSTVTIKWRINDLSKVSSVGVKISIDNGKSYDLLVDHSIPPDTTAIPWIVTADKVGSQCIVEIYEYLDESINDKSGVFSVTN